MDRTRRYARLSADVRTRSQGQRDGCNRYQAAYPIAIERGEQTERIDISPAWFDCNEKTAAVSVSESGLDSERWSTLLTCPETPIEDLRDFLRKLVA